MNQPYDGPDDPRIVEAVLARLDGLTREQWLAHIAHYPGEEPDRVTPGLTPKVKPRRSPAPSTGDGAPASPLTPKKLLSRKARTTVR